MRAFKKKRPDIPLTREEALACIPVRNPRIRETRGEAGHLLLACPVEIRPWIAGLLRRFGSEGGVRTKSVQLDELGTAVWAALDGRRSVGEVIQAFAAAQRLLPREAEVAVTAFLRELGRRGWIGLRRPGEEGPA